MKISSVDTIIRLNHRKYSGAGFLAGTPLVSFDAASNFL